MTRGSVRLRLTALFASLFLVSGAGLLGITYGLVSNANNDIIVARFSSVAPADGATPATGSPGSPGTAGAAAGATLTGPGAADLPDPGLIQAQATQYASDTRARENDALLLYSGIALAIMAVIAAVLGWFAAGRALRPLRRITESARRICATNLHERLAVQGPDDDVRELADMIDGLFARLDASLHAQRQFVANASHELRTPLARSRTLLEVALRNPGASAESLRAACERAIAAGDEQERLIEALLVLARGQRGLARSAPVDLAAVTRDVLAARGGLIATSGLSVEVTLEPGLAGGDRALIERAVANLADNALRHNVARGAVWVTVGSDGGGGFLTIANTGAEVPPDAVERLLLPFQRGPGARDDGRTRARTGPGDGLGLGLSIVAAIAAAHGAKLTLTPRLSGGGLSVRVAFPAAPASLVAAAGQAVPAGSALPGRREARAPLTTSPLPPHSPRRPPSFTTCCSSRCRVGVKWT
jgi:signal transduction histidine kinase